MPKQKILIVDDEIYIRMLYREELELDGFDVATSSGEEDIISLVEREQPDAVTMDIKLGVRRSGLDMLTAIKDRFPDLPVILFTAYDNYVNDSRSKHADSYVVKSLDPGVMKAAVHDVLSRTAA